MYGVSHLIEMYSGNPTEEQIAAYAVLIRSLRDMKYEHICFDFLDPDKTWEGLVFYQVARDGDLIHAEVRIDRTDGKHMFAIKIPDEKATELLRKLIRTRVAPDVSAWEDITDRVFHKKK